MRFYEMLRIVKFDQSVSIAFRRCKYEVLTSWQEEGEERQVCREVQRMKKNTKNYGKFSLVVNTNVENVTHSLHIREENQFSTRI